MSHTKQDKTKQNSSQNNHKIQNYPYLDVFKYKQVGTANKLSRYTLRFRIL